MRTTVEEQLAEARASIPRFTPREAEAAVAEGAIMVDIRPVEQRLRDGSVPGAVVVERNVLEWRLDPDSEWRDPRLARRDRPVVLICDEGYQSSLAAAFLRRFGVDAGDVIGGVQAWKEEGVALNRRAAALPPVDGPKTPACLEFSARQREGEETL